VQLLLKSACIRSPKVDARYICMCIVLPHPQPFPRWGKGECNKSFHLPLRGRGQGWGLKSTNQQLPVHPDPILNFLIDEHLLAAVLHTAVLLDECRQFLIAIGLIPDRGHAEGT